MPIRTNAIGYDGIFAGRPQAESYVQPREDADLVQEIREWIRTVEQYRGQFEQSWKLNHAFLRGDQHLGRHKITGDIVRLSQEDTRRVKVKHNVLAPIARSLTGKLSAMVPTFSVMPATADFEERQAAIAADSIIQLVREYMDLDQKYDEANRYMPDIGNAFFYLTWNPSAGRKVSFCEACSYFSYDLET